jgi:hypothetical protein
MADFGIQFDLSELEKEFNFFKDINKHLNKAIEKLAGEAYEKAIQFVQQGPSKLTSRQAEYLKNLEFKKEGSGKDAMYIIILHEPAMWIEEGVKAHNMKDTHLKGKDKVIIPFNHNKRNAKGEVQSSMMAPKQQDLYKEVKSFLKKNKVSLNKPINDNSGKPIISSPGNIKPAASFGKVPSKTVGKNSGESVLNRLNVYQHATKDKSGKSQITSTAMTFRTVSKNSEGWDVPDLKAALILDKVYSWILENYEKILMEQLPDLILQGV